MTYEWNVDFFSKYERCLKSIETEAVFTKTERNNEWNVSFQQNMNCVQKVLRLKRTLQEMKWIINERLIFFKYELC